MTNNKAPQILIISGACCSPGLSKLDLELENNLSQVLVEMNLSIDVQKISLSAVLNNIEKLSPKQVDQIAFLFRKYGTKFTPAIMVDDVVCYAGKPPVKDQLKEILAKELASKL